MKIGMLVGAVGLALAGAAYADHGASATVDSKAGLNAGVANTTQNSLEVSDFVKARNAAVGAPGSAQFRRTVDQVRAGIAGGYINPRTCLLEAGRMGLKTFNEEGLNASVAGAPPSADPNQRAGSNLAGTTFAYFDGFETYTISPDLSVIPPVGPGRINGQAGPGGSPVASSSMYAAVALPTTALTSTWTYNPAVPLGKNPYTPGMAGGYPVDRDAAVEQALMQGMGTRVNAGGDAARLTGNFLGANVLQPTLYAPTGAAGTPPNAPLICTTDFYSADAEDSQAWSAVSFVEGFIITRIYCGGYDFGGTLAEGDGHILRPQILGPLANNFTIGQFFAPPILSGPLPTYHYKLNEWYTFAIRMSTTRFKVYVRDSGTDGSATFTIDDDADDQYFETGWSELFPGKAATNVVGNTYRGYGTCVTEFGEVAPQPANLLAAVSVNGIQILVGGEPTVAQLPTFHPSNVFQDNFALIGVPFPTPVVPDLVLPYKDDMERYFTGGNLALQGGRWTDNLSSRATVTNVLNTTTPPGSDGSLSPSKSLLQSNLIVQDGVMRVEFFSDTPPGPAGAADVNPLNRPFATPASPVSVNAMIKVTNNTTVRAFGVNDNDVDFVGELLLLGARDINSNVDGRFFIRLTNPTFDPATPTSNNDFVDFQPSLANNGQAINWPTTTSINTPFVKLELVMFGNGTCVWKAGGVELTFDSAFYSLDVRLEEMLKVAKRIQLGLPANAAVSGPYTRFPSVMSTCDQVTNWSGNTVGGFGDEYYVDDLRVDAPARSLALGPDFTLMYMDDFSKYPLGQSISQQGDTNAVFAPANSNTVSKVATVRGSWLSSGSFPATTDWCSYTIQEIFTQFDRDGNAFPDQWGFAVNNTIFVRKPFVGFTCETRASVAGKSNFTLVDPAAVTPRRNGVLRVGAPVNNTSDGTTATFRSDNDRYLATAFFCRYNLVTVVADNDASMGGTPFALPAGWTVGAKIAVDNLFAQNAMTGIRACPGATTGNSTWRIFSDNNIVQAHGTWTCVSTQAPLCAVAIPPNPPDFTPVGSAANNVPNTDVKGYAFNALAAPRWDDLINVTFVASGYNGDGWIRNAHTELDAVKTALAGSDVNIDPLSKFGNVLAFRNFGAGAPSGHTEFASGAVNLPLAQSVAAVPNVSGAKHASVYYDIYVQDNNTRIYIAHDGVETDCNGGGGIVAELRFGGPDALDGVPAANFGKLTSATTLVYADTGVAVPLGKWFRVNVESNIDGTWKAGYNDLGVPGGPGGPVVTGGSGAGESPKFYDQTLVGAHPNAHLITSGASLPGPNMLPITNIGRLTFGQGCDLDGDGIIDLDRVHAESLGPAVVPPVGGGITGPLSWCFYEIQTLDAAPVPSTQITGISPTTGVTGAVRAISAATSDIIAVRFNNVPANGPVITSFAQCPQNGDFDITNSGGATVTAQGTWALLGIPGNEGFDGPSGGIQNAGAPANGHGYNFPGVPARNILLAKWKVGGIPAIPTSEVSSNWWIDNLKLQVRSDGFQPPCPADFTGNGSVGSDDLPFILGAWTTGGHPFNPMTETIYDLDHSGAIGSGDVALLLGQWGACPPFIP